MESHSAAVQEAVRTLREEESRLATELETQRLRLGTLVSDLKRVRVSLATLQGEERGQAIRLAGGKPGLTDHDALQLVTKCLEQGSSSFQDLKQRLLAHAKSLGVSGTGVHLVLTRVLKGPRFTETERGYELADLKSVLT